MLPLIPTMQFGKGRTDKKFGKSEVLRIFLMGLTFNENIGVYSGNSACQVLQKNLAFYFTVNLQKNVIRFGQIGSKTPWRRKARPKPKSESNSAFLTTPVNNLMFDHIYEFEFVLIFFLILQLSSPTSKGDSCQFPRPQQKSYTSLKNASSSSCLIAISKGEGHLSMLLFNSLNNLFTHASR